MHRDKDPIYKVSDELDIDDDDAREAMVVAQIIFNSPPEEASATAYNTGYRFLLRARMPSLLHRIVIVQLTKSRMRFENL